MIEQRICDPDSIARQRKLMMAFEASAQAWESRRIGAQQAGDTALQATATIQRDIERTVVQTIRKRIQAAALFTADNDDTASWLPPTFAAPPVEFQTYSPPPVATVEQCVSWLRSALPEVWYRQSYATLRPVATWLLWLRQACWSGRWLPWRAGDCLSQLSAPPRCWALSRELSAARQRCSGAMRRAACSGTFQRRSSHSRRLSDG